MTTMQQRRGTAAQWTSANPTLDAGEIGFETDTNKFKFGDGTTAWNDLTPYHYGDGTILQTYVKNNTGSTIAKGKAVYISGATGANALISLADADLEAASSKTLGLTMQSMATGDSGYVITNGTLTGVDTSAYTEGTALWLSSTAGELTSTKPSAPVHGVYIGVVTRSHATVGEILVKIQNGYELDELHDVLITSNTSGEILKWNGTTWVNNTLAEANVAALTGASFTGTVNVTTDSSAIVLKNTSGSGLRIYASELVSGSLPGVIISPYIDGTEKTNSQIYYGDNGDQWVFEPTVKLGNGTLTTGSATSYIFNSTATTLNIGGAATTINIGSSATGSTMTVAKDLVVNGNLTVQGDQFITNTATLEVEDPLLYIGTGNSGDSSDIGIVGHRTPSGGSYQHTGFVRDATDGVWKLFSGVTTEPTTIIDFTSATYDGIKIGALDATTGTFSGALTYGGVTLTNAVTGTGKMVLDTAPTISGTLTASGGITSALQKASAIAAPYYASVAESAGQFAGFASGAGANSTGSRVIMTASQPSSVAPASRPDGSTLRAGDIWISW